MFQVGVFMKGSYAYLIGADMIAQSNKELGYRITNSNKELSERLKDISDTEIKSKDRVNITLEEYKNMQDNIKLLADKVNNLSYILNQIKIPFDKEIIPDSIKTYWYDDVMNYRHIFRVELAIDNFNLNN